MAAYLLLEEGEISPEFSPSITDYTVSVPYEVLKGSFHIETEDENATYEIINNDSFEVGENTVTIRVTSESQKTKDYTVNITRQESVSGSDYLASLILDNGSLDPEFKKELQYYEVSLPYQTTTMNVTATSEDTEAIVSGNGEYHLEVGKNTILIRVLSTEGKIRDYQIVVTRAPSDDARLKSLYR